MSEKVMIFAGFSMVPVGKPWVIVRSCPPHPNPLPKERESRSPTQVETTSMGQGLAIVLPVLGERVGVRGTGSTPDNGPHVGSLTYPLKTSRNPRSGNR